MFGDFFVCNTDPLSPKNQKDNCSDLVIWTSNMTNIRIQKLFVIGN